ncbi:hypothetical protein BDR26DRAFT_881682 [Obelidium mucronatum]|nr:hypothetical protein BDR26DRAFT_881682 [Obelidium mucronatum]
MVALYLSTRTLHFMCRWAWQRRLEVWMTGRKVSSVMELEEVEAEVNGGGNSSVAGRRKHHHRHHHHHRVSAPQYLHSRQRSLGALDRPEVEALLASSVASSDDGSPLSVAKKNSRVGGTVEKRFSLDSSTSEATTKSEASTTVNKSAEELQIEDEWVLNLRKNVRYAAGTVVMMLSSSQILMAYVLEPQSVASSYQSFLLTHGGIRTHAGAKARDYLQLMAHIIRSGFQGFSTKYLPTNVPSISDATTLPPSYESNLPSSLDAKRFSPYFDYINQSPHEYVMCSLQHPQHTNCELGALHFFSQEFSRALQMYLPLNAIMTVVFRGTSLLKKPGQNLYQYLVGTARSTLFLTCYCTMAWYSICTFRRLTQRDSRWMYYVNGLLSGSMVLIEAPGRRLELGLYCLPRALESFWNCGVKWGWWRDIKNGEGLYFSIMTGVLMMLYQKDPGSIHEGYRKVMFRFFGIN